jgi:hypothetical protein
VSDALSILLWARLLTSHLGDAHSCMLRNRITDLARKSSERVGRCGIHDRASTNLARSVPAGPHLRGLLAHYCRLCANTEQGASRVDVYDTIEFLHINIYPR